MTAAVSGSAKVASAQSLDLGIYYAARGTYPTTDNDLFAAMAGWTWDRQHRGLGFGVTGGVRNEDFSGDYPAILGSELLRSRGTETLQHGLGGRVIWSDDQDTSGELVFGVQTFRQGYLLRGTVGFQTFSGELSIRDDSSAFGVGEFTWYGGSNWAVGAGLQAESDGTLGAFGFECKFGTSDFSLSAEYVAAFDGYRDNDGYADLTVMLRYVPGYSSLRKRDYGSPVRLIRRYVAAR